MPPHRLPTKKAYDTRMPFSPYCHFERKREIFFVCGQAKEARMTDHGKHRTLCGVESRCFMQTALRRKTETANEKDPSTALGMTIRKRAVSHSLSSRGGSEPPPLRTASFRGKEGVCRLPPPRPFSPFKYPHRMAAGAGCIFGVFGMV